MKASKASIARAVERPEGHVRFYLLHGPDQAQARALGSRLVEALGAAKFAVAAGSVKADPALLADEAGAMSLFGGKRALWIEPAGDEITGGVEALLAGPAPESPVVAIAGSLRKSSALLKLAESSPEALAFAAYVPEGAEAEKMVAEVGRRFGLKVSAPVAARLASLCANDQAIAAQELQKLALYVDASPQSPKELDHDAIDAIAADLPEGEVLHLADLALSGRVGDLAMELSNLPPGAGGIPVVRALHRRVLQLSPARARIERGEPFDAVMASLGKSLFWKDKPIVSKMLSLWDSKRLATVAERAGKLETDLFFTPAPEQAALGEELLSIARAAGRR
ncbi:MAG TPA: DNA polymerase III subunit delta [Sphingomicrobium sp.]|nr:DNA polymerase III subunit delta [Sphingomicrobium sp.]